MSLPARVALRLAMALALVLIAGALFAVAAFFTARAVYEPQLPPVEAVRELPLQVPLRIYTRDGKLIGEFGTQRRIPLAYDEMPEQLINAFIAAEDARYFSHPGVDWRGILRAAVNLAMTGERSQGGSTITMQLARNYFLTRERTYDRKIREIFLALRMEEVLSKQQIMESYLNKIYLGERAYGVGAAARVYFGVPVEELSLSQMAVLAGLPKAPSRDNPANNPDRARERRDYVLGRMLALDYIDQERFQAAREEAVLVTPEEYTVELDAHYVAEMVRQEMVARYGEAVYEDG
ncbi:MAG: transglycosylase domain-containing protein, partial [Algiphilus sp.]